MTGFGKHSSHIDLSYSKEGNSNCRNPASVGLSVIRNRFMLSSNVKNWTYELCKSGHVY